MAMFNVHVTPDSGTPFDVPIGMRTILVWEKVGRGRSLSRLAELSAMDMYSLTFTAAKASGQWTGTEAEFEAQCELEATADGDDLDPTQPAPSAAESSN
jgi:hypothetical protein